MALVEGIATLRATAAEAPAAVAALTFSKAIVSFSLLLLTFETAEKNKNNNKGLSRTGVFFSRFGKSCNVSIIHELVFFL